MSETTEFDDLNLLDAADVAAVFDQVPQDDVVAALWGAPAGLRVRLVNRLRRPQTQVIEQAIAAIEHLTFEQVRGAQQRIVAAMCRLSRGGQIAFDPAEDMAA